MSLLYRSLSFPSSFRTIRNYPSNVFQTKTQTQTQTQLNITNRYVTTSSALSLLHLSSSTSPLTYQTLRKAYFRAAKRCHPDTNTQTTASRDAAQIFLELTNAYEYLLPQTIPDADFGTTQQSSQAEEDEYREACELWLNLPAEVVEESKKCPLFRQWLRGNTDSALKWNMFLCLNGGLAPRLNLKEEVLMISSGGDDDIDVRDKDHMHKESSSFDGKVRRRRRQTSRS